MQDFKHSDHLNDALKFLLIYVISLNLSGKDGIGKAVLWKIYLGRTLKNLLEKVGDTLEGYYLEQQQKENY